MKGIAFTLSILIIFFVIFSLSSEFSSKTTEFFDILSKNLILDKVYNTFVSIEYAVQRMMIQQVDVGGINVTIEEKNGFNIVTFSETLPRKISTSKFSEDLENFEKFAETKLNEINLITDLTLDVRCLSFVIQPYNITYVHNPAVDCLTLNAHTEIVIDPQDSWQYLENYSFIFKVDGNITDAHLTGWSGPGCEKAGLGLNITLIGNDVVRGPFVTRTQYNKMCRFNIDNVVCSAGLGSTGSGYVHITHNQNSDVNDKGWLKIEVHPSNCNVTSTVSLNLTDIPGKTFVDAPSQTIKIKEALYQIEKNDTIRISGE